MILKHWITSASLILGLAFTTTTVQANDSFSFPFKHPDRFQAPYTEQRFLPSLAQPMTSQGVLTFSKGQGIMWHMTQPFSMRTIITPHGAVQYIEDEKQPADAELNTVIQPIMNSISAIFEGNYTTLKDLFSVSETSSGQYAHCFALKPLTQSISAYVNQIDICGADVVKNVKITYSPEKYTVVTYGTQTIPDAATWEKERAYFEK